MTDMNIDTGAISAGMKLSNEDSQGFRPSFKNSPWNNRKLFCGAIVLGILLILALAGFLFWDRSLVDVGSSPTNLPPVGFTYRGHAGSWAHPMGTDNSGKDVMSLILIGMPYSLGIGFVAAIIGLSIGIFLGFSSGYLGGWVDDIVRLSTDVTVSIPALLVLILIQALIPNAGFFIMAVLLALFGWQNPTRTLRAQVLSMKHSGYIKLSQLSGSSVLAVMFEEMMPNLLPYLVEQLTAGISYSVLVLVGLEVLGLGSQRIPSLGVILNNAINASAIIRGMWWWWGIPTIILIIIFLCLLLISVGLDEVSNPRLRNK